MKPPLDLAPTRIEKVRSSIPPALILLWILAMVYLNIFQPHPGAKWSAWPTFFVVLGMSVYGVLFRSRGLFAGLVAVAVAVGVFWCDYLLNGTAFSRVVMSESLFGVGTICFAVVEWRKMRESARE